jgi:hypothetical protein
LPATRNSRKKLLPPGCAPQAINDLDDRFFKLDLKRLEQQNHDFLLGLPCLRLVPQAAGAEEMEKMPFLNPKLKETERVIELEKERAR